MNRELRPGVKFLTIFLHFGFFVVGIVTVLIGQILPILSARLSLNDKQAGYFFIAQFSGSIAGVLLSGQLVKNFGFIRSTLVGFALISVGILLLNSAYWIICLTAFFVFGIGIGITIPAINMLIVELNPTRISTSLNILNTFWGIGAIICKPFIDIFGTSTSLLIPSIIISVSLVLTAIAIILLPKGIEPQLAISDDLEAPASLPIWTTVTAWLIALFNFIHVGFESGVGGWVTSYEQRMQNSSAIKWIPAILVFYLMFVAGRALATVFLRYLTENIFILLSVLIMTLGVVIALAANSTTLLALGSGIIGFGTSAIFPTNMARFNKTFGSDSTRRATPLFIAGTIGGAATTYFIGYISTIYSDLRSGMIVLFVSCLALIALQIYLTFKLGRITETI